MCTCTAWGGRRGRGGGNNDREQPLPYLIQRILSQQVCADLDARVELPLAQLGHGKIYRVYLVAWTTASSGVLARGDDGGSSDKQRAASFKHLTACALLTAAEAQTHDAQRAWVCLIIELTS